MGDVRVPKRIAAVIINSLKGGVVPRIGLPYVTVGRESEIQALLHDLELVADGGASFRFLVGRYGAGKSFLLQTIRTHAMGNDFVVADADLSPERRLQGGQGQGLATYRELIRNLSTKTRPEGGALALVLDRWVAALREQPDAETALAAQLSPIQELVCGFDFTQVLRLYYRASLEGNDETRAGVVKWLRGEFRTKTEARTELGVNACITDDTWYEYLKLFAQFLVGAGYQGLIVLIDELVNLYKIPNATSRQYNYEKILTMYNDTLQGKLLLRGPAQPPHAGALCERRPFRRARAGHPPGAPHLRGAARAHREARGHPRRLLRIRAHAHRGAARRLPQGRVRPCGRGHPPHATRGHPRLHRASRHRLPEPGDGPRRAPQDGRVLQRRGRTRRRRRREGRRRRLRRIHHLGEKRLWAHSRATSRHGLPRVLPRYSWRISSTLHMSEALSAATGQCRRSLSSLVTR